MSLLTAHVPLTAQDMDRDKNGKVTMSELEDAALAIGFTLEQTRRLFDK